MRPVFCMNCLNRQTYSVGIRPVEITVSGVTFIHQEMYAVCNRCGKEVYVPEINDDNARHRLFEYEQAKRGERSSIETYIP